MTKSSSEAGRVAPCGECGMPCKDGEYHPFAACLMFKACCDSLTVRANLQAVRRPVAPLPAAGGHLSELEISAIKQIVKDAHFGRTMQDFLLRIGIDTNANLSFVSVPIPPPLTAGTGVECQHGFHRIVCAECNAPKPTLPDAWKDDAALFESKDFPRYAIHFDISGTGMRPSKYGEWVNAATFEAMLTVGRRLAVHLKEAHAREGALRARLTVEIGESVALEVLAKEVLSAYFDPNRKDIHRPMGALNHAISQRASRAALAAATTTGGKE